MIDNDFNITDHYREIYPDEFICKNCDKPMGETVEKDFMPGCGVWENLILTCKYCGEVTCL